MDFYQTEMGKRFYMGIIPKMSEHLLDIGVATTECYKQIESHNKKMDELINAINELTDTIKYLRK